MARRRALSRRDFLRGSAAMAGGLVIAFHLPGGGRRAFAQAPAAKAVPPNAFLRIDKDGTCTVIVKHLEFGQGVTTSLPMLLAEELDCDWGRVRFALAPAAPEYVHTAFGVQITGGSSSVWNSWEQLRTAGAQGRAMLLAAAAEQWKVDAKTLRTAKGQVLGPGGKKLSYGALAERAGKLPVPEKVALKDPKDFTLIGKPTRRIDAAQKVDGSAIFGLDVKRPNLHTALVAHPPVFGARVKRVDAEKVKSVPGVTHVVQTSNGVAVVAKSFWAAKRGRDALQVEWDLGPNAALSTEALAQKLRETAKAPGRPARAGNAGALEGAARTLVAEYEVPFLAHAAMEPLNCVVEVRGDGAELWVGSQFQGVDQAAAAKALGLDPSKVKLNTMLAGGGFGRRANPVSDYVVEACEVAREAKVPVKLVWTREDDIRGGYYRPMFAHRVEAGLDDKGALLAWRHTLAGPSIVAGTPFEAMMVKDGIDPTSVEGVADTPYAIPNLQVSLHTVDTGVPVLWWRSVGHSHTAFVMESMIDEVAAAARKDPLALRRELLAKHPRHLRVLDLAAEKSGWGKAAPAGRARGIAIAESFGAVCAQVAEVSVDGGKPRVHRVVAAFDCGRVVNPLTVEAQLQSAIAFGLSAALHGRITVKDGRVEQSNFHDYPVLRMHEMPRVEVHLVASEDKPAGVGEPGVPPIAPAVANALYALTGKRARALPLSTQAWA